MRSNALKGNDRIGHCKIITYGPTATYNFPLISSIVNARGFWAIWAPRSPRGFGGLGVLEASHSAPQTPNTPEILRTPQTPGKLTIKKVILWTEGHKEI